MRITLKMFCCPPQHCAMAQNFRQPFPKPGRNVFTQLCICWAFHLLPPFCLCNIIVLFVICHLLLQPQTIHPERSLFTNLFHPFILLGRGRESSRLSLEGQFSVSFLHSVSWKFSLWCETSFFHLTLIIKTRTSEAYIRKLCIFKFDNIEGEIYRMIVYISFLGHIHTTPRHAKNT